MSFGKRMQACREELGISQLALARQIGVSQSTIGNYEAGISFPKEDILLRLFDCRKHTVESARHAAHAASLRRPYRS